MTKTYENHELLRNLTIDQIEAYEKIIVEEDLGYWYEWTPAKEWNEKKWLK